jgi:hypothetical protein
MPEPPDFEAIALDCLGLLSATDDPLVESGRLVLVSRIAEQLRLMWNARGATDLGKLEWELSNVTVGPLQTPRPDPLLTYLVRALKTLDR